MRRLGKVVLVVAILFVVFVALVVWPAPAPLKPNQTTPPLVITNVSVVDPEADTLLSGQTVVIEQGRITTLAANDSLTIPEGAQQIDGSGKFLIPGLWDMHAHLGWALAPQLTMPLFIAGGVTNIRELGGFAPLELKKKWQAEIQSGALLGPRVMGQATAIIAWLSSEEEARQRVALVDGETNFIKVYNQVLPDLYFALLEEANKKDVSVLGHRPRAVRAIDAAEAGHKSFEHARLFLFECYPGAEKLRARYRAIYAGEDTSSAPLGTTALRREMIDTHDPTLFDELVAAMVEHGAWFCPTHLTRKMDAFADNEAYRTDPRLKYIHFTQRMYWDGDADGMIDVDPSPEGRKAFMDFYLKGLELTGKAHRAGVKILAGTDANDTYAFPGLGMHDELQELMKAGLTPMEALQTATVNPAEYFGLSSAYGSIAPGKVADVVMLDANPLDDIANTAAINTVIYNGNLYTRKDLDQMLAYVERNSASIPLAFKLAWLALSE